MIFGIGTDIEEIKRFFDIKEKKRLMDKCFSSEEQKYIFSKKQFAQSAAGIYCAKEALYKALGTGMGAFDMTEAGVYHDIKGAPYFEFFGKVKKIFENKKVFLSISHSGNYAAATVIIETEDIK